MPVVNTGGFQVQELPRVQFADPRLLTPNYSGIASGVGQGLSLYDHLAQIGDSAITDPIKQEMLRVQLQDAQNRLANAPLEQQLKLAQLSEIQQNAAVPHQFADSVGVVGGVNLPRPTDLSVPFEQIKFSEDYTPRVKITTGREIGAGGAVTPYTRNETLATGPQVAAEVARAKAINAANERRGEGKTFEYEQTVQKREQAKAEGDAEAVAFYDQRLDKLNATTAKTPWVTAKSSVDAAGNLVLNQVNRETGELRETPTNRKPSISELERLLIEARGGATAPIVPSSPSGVAKDLIGKFSAPAPTSFGTADEAAAAAASGLIKPGDKITVGGVPGTWQ